MQAVQQSLKRIGTPTLDLVQFYWQDYSQRDYLSTAQRLADEQERGTIKHLGLTNFDVPRIQAMQDRGVRFVSNQVRSQHMRQLPVAACALPAEAQLWRLSDLCWAAPAEGESLLRTACQSLQLLVFCCAVRPVETVVASGA